MIEVLQPAATLEDIVISPELLSRSIHIANRRDEVEAMYGLSRLLPGGLQPVLKRLAQLAIELCGADSGGVSILEESKGKQVFRWTALAGEFEPYEGGETPREWSPCGECLNAGKAMLYSYPARFFTYFQDVPTQIVEGLVVPMQADEYSIGTVWIVSSRESHRFDAEDVRVMTSLSAFVTAAIRWSKVPLAGDPYAERESVWQELIRRVAHGDGAALELLIEETKPYVFSRALRVLSSPADAEETTADVYWQVSRIAARYDETRQHALAWLFNLTRSRAIDRLRARTRYDQSLESALSVEHPPSADPESKAMRGQIADQVQRAMLTLPLEQKRAIELAYFRGHSAAEIASLLGHPVGSVKSRIRRGVTTLRLLLAAQQ